MGIKYFGFSLILSDSIIGRNIMLLQNKNMWNIVEMEKTQWSLIIKKDLSTLNETTL